MMETTLDTNALASGFVGFEVLASVPGELIRRWYRGEFGLVISRYIIDELQRTFGKTYFRGKLTPGQMRRADDLLRSRGRLTSLTVPVSGVATHPEDDLILATALSGGATYVVTGDRPFQSVGSYRGVAIVSPRTFLSLLEAEAVRLP